MTSATGDSASIRLVPLGGLGEIGMNCLAIEQDEGILVVDCGTAFPHDDRGVDVIHPDFQWLLDRADDVVGVFITHGHEDHVGGVPFLLRDLDVPIYASPHALAVIRRRLEEHAVDINDVDLEPILAGQVHEIGPFRVESIRVSHSIVEATAFAIETSAGTVLHTGDFNFDEDPPDGEPTDVERLRELGDSGVALLLSDSTNIDVPVRAGAERNVGGRLQELVASAQHRVFVVMFASNVQRLRMLGEIAQRTQRKICLLGRSLNAQVDIATAVGRLAWPADLKIAAEQARDLPRDRLLILAGGSQAEPTSAAVRLAHGMHQHLAIEPGDAVVFSSRVIPGNEVAVHDLLCSLLRLGARVHTRQSDPDVHTSGHAGRSEQRRMLELVRPRCFVPVHGTLHHLVWHAELARQCGVPVIAVTENGAVLRIDRTGIRPDGTVPHGRVHVAIGGEALDAATLERREELGRSGIAFVSLVVDGSRRLRCGPTVFALGIPAVDSADQRVIAGEVVRALERHRKIGLKDPLLAGEIRRAARRALLGICGYRPPVEVLIQVADP
ncbi:MAG: ribonuclease J [Polyangiaceae bacterium]|nr:ribonuclease J [Polyangiaceae bacterium]